MSLLGNGFDDPQSNMILGLAQGLLSARGGAGLAAGLGGMQAAQQQAMKNKLLDAQLKNYDSEIEARKLAGIKDARQQALIASMFGGGADPAAAPASGGQSFSSAPGTQGGAPGGGQGANLIQLAKQYGIPEQAIQSDMVFNGGKGIADMLFKRGAPDMQVTNGYAYDKNRQGAGYLPQLNISNDGKATQVQIGPDGQPVISAPRGAPETFGTYQGIEAGVKSANTPLKVYNPGTQREEFMPQSTVLGGQAPGGMPNRTGNPMIDAVMQTESGGNPNAVSPAGARGLMQVMPGTNTAPGFGVAPARDNSEGERTRVGRDYHGAMMERYKDPALAAIAYNWGPGNTDMWLKGGGDYSKLPKETQSYVSQVLTRNGVNGRGGQSPQQAPAGGFAAGPSADEAAQAKANEARTVDSAKAGAARIMTGYDNAQAASESITAINESRKAIQGGSFVGSGAETKLALSKGLQALGFDVKPEQVSNTDYLNSQLGQGILNKAKTLGANPTDNDARIIRDIVGSIGKDPQALNKLLDFQESMARRSIEQHNKNYGDAKGRGFDAGFDLNVNLPSKPAAGAPPLPANPTAQTLTKGQAYKLPNGAEAVWDGMRFKGK